MKKHAQLLYLMRLMEIGAKDRFVRASTPFLSTLFGVSQQSSSRILNELHDSGYIEKEIREGVIWLKLTDEALIELLRLREDLTRALNNPGFFEFEGKVFGGLREGAYYMSKRGYRKQFYRRLGFDPYPGTLNVRLEDPNLVRLNTRLRGLRGIHILGFEDVERSYGEVKVFKALINEETPGAVIIASRTAYGSDVLEVISPFNLREKLGLKDGELVRVKVYLTDTL
ncbi:MAG: DUF120 domain-containing protein [Candidatus Geothermarchaeales archaeon]